MRTPSDFVRRLARSRAGLRAITCVAHGLIEDACERGDRVLERGERILPLPAIDAAIDDSCGNPAHLQMPESGQHAKPQPGAVSARRRGHVDAGKVSVLELIGVLAERDQRVRRAPGSGPHQLEEFLRIGIAVDGDRGTSSFM